MFGFFVGTVSLIGLAAMAFRGRRHRYAHGMHGMHRGMRYGMHRGFRRRALYYVLERLDTTPGQEKAILEAIDGFTERARAAADDARETRKDVAEAFRADAFDRGSFAALFDVHVDAATALRDEFAKTVATIHEILNERQRQRLADLLETGPRFAYGC
ncbi:MAG TPA: periplasmic heavy metal sensor [Polyangiaceae bacterium]|jgi:Spy/CpxP family protein refolding chaperone|nr:periplasmic heavy metal sensor [Polyangiaceae bacterium]